LELEPALEDTRDRLAAVPDNGRLTEYAERLLAHLRTSDEGSIAHETCSQARVARLSPRETDVLELMSTGRSNKRIAAALGVSPETVKSYINSIFMKLEVDNRTRAVVEGRRLNLVRAD